MIRRCAIPMVQFCRYVDYFVVCFIKITVQNPTHCVLLCFKFLYGEDGLDICKSRYLNEKGIPFLVDNRECIRLAENSPSIDLEAAKSVKSASKSVCILSNQSSLI